MNVTTTSIEQAKFKGNFILPNCIAVRHIVQNIHEEEQGDSYKTISKIMNSYFAMADDGCRGAPELNIVFFTQFKNCFVIIFSYQTLHLQEEILRGTLFH